MNPLPWRIGSVLLVLATMVGCLPDVLLHREPTKDDLALITFRTHVQVNAQGQFEADLEVYNAGKKSFPGDDAFHGVMEIRDAEGTLRARAEVVPLGALKRDSSAFPIYWQDRLPAGRYRLVWGAPQYGGVEQQFAIVERDGRLYLGEDQTVAPAALPRTNGQDKVQATG